MEKFYSHGPDRTAAGPGGRKADGAEPPLVMPGYPVCHQCGESGRESRMFFDDAGYVCPTCYNPYLHKITGKNFFSQLPSALAFPVRGNNGIMLVSGAVFFGALTFFSRMSALATGMAGLAGGAFLAEFLMSIITATASGSDDLPDWPDFTLGKVCTAGLQFAAAWIGPLVPAFICYVLLVRTGCGGFYEDMALIVAAPTFNGDIYALLLLAGLFLIPAATASVSTTFSFSASIRQLSPHVLFPIVYKAFTEYLVICAGVALIGILNAGTQMLCTVIGGGWIGSAIAVPFTLYFLMAEMRLIGLFLRLSGRRKHNEENWKLLEAGELPYRKRIAVFQ